MSNVLVYVLDGKIYINLTNKCTNDCIFCLRKDKDDVEGQKLWLEHENSTAEEVIAQFKEIYANCPTNEVIFCGYGEPMLKFDNLKIVSMFLRATYPNIKIRVNTNGHANYVYKKNIVHELKGLIDEFSVSLNGATEEEYNELSQPVFANAYEEVKKFIKACADEGISVVASVVEGYKGRHLDLDACEKIATDLGAKFRVREWIVNGY